MTAAAMMANPAAAMAALAGQTGGLMGQGLGAMPTMTGFGGPGFSQPFSNELLHSDPAFAAAAERHARDMALLRMDVEKARGAAELQQIRSQLAQLQQTAMDHGPQQLAASLHEVVEANRQRRTSDEAAGQQQWEQQDPEDPDGAEEGGSMQHKVAQNTHWEMNNTIKSYVSCLCA